MDGKIQSAKDQTRKRKEDEPNSENNLINCEINKDKFWSLL